MREIQKNTINCCAFVNGLGKVTNAAEKYVDREMHVLYHCIKYTVQTDRRLPGGEFLARNSPIKEEKCTKSFQNVR